MKSEKRTQRKESERSTVKCGVSLANVNKGVFHVEQDCLNELMGDGTLNEHCFSCTSMSWPP